MRESSSLWGKMIEKQLKKEYLEDQKDFKKSMKKLGLISLIVCYIITVTFLSLLVFSWSESTLENFNFLRHCFIIYALVYSLILIFYFCEIHKKSLFIRHKCFIYGQIINIFLNFLILFWSIDWSQSTNSIFPGYYFIKYFSCLGKGWGCLGFEQTIMIFFNSVIITSLGFILGLIYSIFPKK